MEELYSYHNGSKLYKTTIRRILEIPVWGGNRALDRSHVEKIRNSMNTEQNRLNRLIADFTLLEFQRTIQQANNVFRSI
jgi:hypothetical protein